MLDVVDYEKVFEQETDTESVSRDTVDPFYPRDDNGQSNVYGPVLDVPIDDCLWDDLAELLAVPPSTGEVPSPTGVVPPSTGEIPSPTSVVPPSTGEVPPPLFRNKNVRLLRADLINLINTLYNSEIATSSEISQLETCIKDCLDQGKVGLAKALARHTTMSPKEVEKLLSGKQTTNTRALVLSLVTYRAKSFMASEELHQYFSSTQFSVEFQKMWEKPPSSKDVTLLINCMGLLKLMRDKLKIKFRAAVDDEETYGKKGIAITAAVMIADCERTYSNGGGNGKVSKILEAMYDSITGCPKVTRKRSAEEMYTSS